MKSIKFEIKEQLIAKVSKELESIKEAAKSTKDLNTKGDMKSDGKYDTRAIEAGYLAGAQSKRVKELEEDLVLLEKIPSNIVSEKAMIGSLLTLECGGQRRKYFLSSTSGGTIIKVQDEVVLVISVFSPIGDGVLELAVGDEFEVTSRDTEKIYKILKIA